MIEMTETPSADIADAARPMFSGVAPCWASDDGNVQLWNADCLDVLPLLSGIDAVITDPPYGMAWNTDLTRFTGGAKGHRNDTTGAGSGRNYGKPIEGDHVPFDPAPWLGFEKVVMFGVNHFGQRVPVGTQLIWIKKYDPAFGSFLSDAELAWMKGGHGVYCKRDLSMNGETATRMHPTQKPVSLMVWCLEKAKVPTGATVLDPYMGSGSTGIACIRTGRRFVGIEKEAAHFQNAKERIRKELQIGRLF